MIKEEFLADKLLKLSNSKFRSSFKLRKQEIDYINNKGIDIVKMHADEFINKRLSQAIIQNDGKQTPMRGHPVFVAQHATATCCRGCLEKWHGIKKGKALTDKQREFISDLIICWIKRQMEVIYARNRD